MTKTLTHSRTRLARAIEDTGLHAYVVGGRAGLSQSLMSKLMNGRLPSAHQLVALSRVLEKDPEELTGFDGLPVDFECDVPTDRDLKRFWRYVEPRDGHLIWTGDHFPSGHPRFKFLDRSTYPHRLAYIWFIRPIPVGSWVRPCSYSKSCVNPFHMKAQGVR